MSTVLQNAIQAAILADDKLPAACPHSFTDPDSREFCQGCQITAVVTAAWTVFDAHLIEKLVDSYLKNRVAGIQEGRRLAAQAVQEALTHPPDVQPVPDWLRLTAMNAARGV